MSSIRLQIAGEQDVPILLTVMKPFNAFEQTPWDPVAKERALKTPLSEPSLGVIGLLVAAVATRTGRSPRSTCLASGSGDKAFRSPH